MKRAIIFVMAVVMLACATTGMQKKEEEAPLRVSINAPKEKVYQITAKKLMEYGFEIKSSDPVLGRITTNYTDLKAGAATSALLKTLTGSKNFKASITTQISESNPNGCEIVMRGMGQYAEDKGLFRDDEIHHQPVRRGTYVYEQMEKMTAEIKREAER